MDDNNDDETTTKTTPTGMTNYGSPSEREVKKTHPSTSPPPEAPSSNRLQRIEGEEEFGAGEGEEEKG